jgi:hypothetical protein
MSCDALTPISAFQSTNLNSKIDSFNRLGERIVRSLGAPLISVEIHQDQLFENISLACEMFSKFAGYTKEYLVFDSALYERGKGTRLDVLYTLSNQTLSLQDKLKHQTTSASTSPYISKPQPVYIVSCPLTAAVFLNNSELSSNFTSDLQKNQIFDKSTYDLLNTNLKLSNFFAKGSTSYVGVTGYHTALNDIPRSVFSGSSELYTKYSEGISSGQVFNNTNYSEISSFTSNFVLSNFFDVGTDYIINYRVVSPLLSSIFLDNSNLSSLYSNGIQSPSSITDIQFDELSSNLTDVSLNYFVSSYDISSYNVSPSLCANIFASYENLSSEFLSGLNDNQVIPQSAVDLINEQSGSGFPINLFFELSVLSSFDAINNIPAQLFLDNPSLSDQYGPSGIVLNDHISKSEFDDLILNQPNITLNYFVSSQAVSSYAISPAISSNILSAFSNLIAEYPDGILDNQVVSQSAIDLISQESGFGFPISLFFESTELSSFNLINTLPKELFLDIESLSATYGSTGIIAPTSLDANQHKDITDNIDFVHFRYFYSLYDTSIKYTVTTPITSTIIEHYPISYSTYSNGLTADMVLTSTEYDAITSEISPGFDTNYFFSISTLSSYYSINNIPSNVFLDNPSLSDQYGSTGITASTAFTVSDFEFISSNLSAVSFSYYYTLDHEDRYYSFTVPISGEVFSQYSELSSLYGDGIAFGTVLSEFDYDFINVEISGNFDITDFLKLSATPYSIHTCTTSLCSILFENSPVLSSVYTQGISSSSVLNDLEYSILLSNFDSSLNNFLSSTPQSSINYNYNYTTIDYIHKDVTDATPLSNIYVSGLAFNTTIDENNYNILISSANNLAKSYFCESITEGVSNSCAQQCSPNSSILYSSMFDYDIMDYRKVISVTDFEEGSTSGINTLFTIEQTLAQQTYFSYAMGNYGFDLISWWTVKNWLETREKVLAIRRAYEFDERTQYLKMYPEPTDSVRFYGALACYVERPLRDLIKEPWVYKYALALTKITVGTIRGKFGSTQAFGGQIFSQDLIQQGITERDALEQQLYTTSAGLGDADPVSFFIG